MKQTKTLELAQTALLSALIVLLASVGLSFLTLFSLIATALCLGFLAWRVATGLSKFPARMEKSMARLGACYAEIAEYQRFYADNLAKRQELEAMIDYL